MSAVATAVVGGSVVSGLISNRAADKAAGAQTSAAELAAKADLKGHRLDVREQARQFDEQMKLYQDMQKLLAPYREAGTSALSQESDLLGLNGPEAQAKAIKMLEDSPQFAAMLKQGETAILQNASATGGLRGGNTQSALMSFRPDLLNSMIQNQFQNLRPISNSGQNAVLGAGTGPSAPGVIPTPTGADYYTTMGNANAGKYLAQGQAMSNVTDSLSTYALLKNLKVF